MNKVILMGRLTKDPEVKYVQGANTFTVARYTLAVNRRFKRDGEPDADFIGCVAFGKSAEFVEKYLKKGQQIAIQGRLQFETWTLFYKRSSRGTLFLRKQDNRQYKYSQCGRYGLLPNRGRGSCR